MGDMANSLNYKKYVQLISLYLQTKNIKKDFKWRPKQKVEKVCYKELIDHLNDTYSIDTLKDIYANVWKCNESEIFREWLWDQNKKNRCRNSTKINLAKEIDVDEKIKLTIDHVISGKQLYLLTNDERNTGEWSKCEKERFTEALALYDEYLKDDDLNGYKQRKYQFIASMMDNRDGKQVRDYEVHLKNKQ